jgi:putative molybdopterin biosynthesis protein
VLLDIDYVGSGKALERLNLEECVLAGVHLPLDDEYLCRRGSIVHAELGRHLRLGEHKLIRFASRQQGLMVAPGNPLGIASIGDLTHSGMRFVNRQPGSGTRVLFDELLRHHGLNPELIAGYETAETTHFAVAACIAAGDANCGFGLHAAAARFGLDFVPVLSEWYFIACRKAALDSAAVQAVIAVLRSEEFRRLAAATPGYCAASAGEIISLRRTLPWYK